jgi:hypothetical protein
MRHKLYASLDELLVPKTLAKLANSTVTSVCCLPFLGAADSCSGSRFLHVETNQGRGPRFVVKRVSCEWDWIMRATADDRGREALVWTTGLLDRLPPEIAHPVLACSHDGAGWAILMHDVSESPIQTSDDMTEGEPIGRTDNVHFLDALAALHAAFWQEPQAADPALGFCSPSNLYPSFSPATGRREIDCPDEGPRIIRDGWELLRTLVDPAVADLLTGLHDDPHPLCAALARYPQTVIHGDPKPANLGLMHNGAPHARVVMLDWHFVGPGVPAADLVRYFSCLGARLPGTREEAVACYRDRLARRLGSGWDEGWWRPQFELSLLGNLLRRGYFLAWLAERHERPAVRAWARREIAWWAEQALVATRWL